VIKEISQKILAGEDLAQEEAVAAMDSIMDGQATSAEIAVFLLALKQKGEKPSEVAGFVQSMRHHSVRLTINDATAVDGCGTGGDGSHSFNISTAAGLIAAAAEVTVAKHGNRSISSSCGSADLLEATGADIDPGPAEVARSIDNVGFGFMFAPRFHPAMKHAAGARKELGVPTVFNILGPMTNPAGVKRQLIGVYDRRLMALMAEVLSMTGSEHVMLVHSHDGMDEFSVSAPTDYLEMKRGSIRRGTISPGQAGLKLHPAGAVTGGDTRRNLNMLQQLLRGEDGACHDAVLFNAGALLLVAGKVTSISEGVVAAAEAVDSGNARHLLERWVSFSKS
jgi:anthranilate phosphoribosyltransferase